MFWHSRCPACGSDRIEFYDHGSAERVKCSACGFDDSTGLSSHVP
jgi:Zn ribbon nucleic-acid-binding protein